MAANTSTVGASSRNITAASVHFGPRNTATISFAKRAHMMVNGTVIVRTSEYPLRK
jgi:hypothetical protein